MPRRFLAVTLVIVFCLLSILSLCVTARGLDTATIVDTAFTVKAGDAKYWNFHVGRAGANVVGRFRAEGGSGNDIICLILDADAFENWRNGHKVRTYYDSGKITVAKIDVRLGEGDYVLVFDNTYSVLTSKAVTAKVEMRS